METLNQFLGTERIGRLMKQYAFPCIISLLVGALCNIADLIFIAIASYLGSYGNAANTVLPKTFYFPNHTLPYALFKKSAFPLYNAQKFIRHGIRRFLRTALQPAEQHVIKSPRIEVQLVFGNVSHRHITSGINFASCDNVQ